jgi:hypothetical protein
VNHLLDTAHENLRRHLTENRYPGRGLVVGRADDGTFRIVYFIMGRSQHSRNRRFVLAGSTLRTEPVDVAAVGDPSLIIYEAMLQWNSVHIVSNGDQTRTVHDALDRGETFEAALATREREPDAPNFTSRITAMIEAHPERPSLALSLLRANRFDPTHTDHTTHRPALVAAGLGYCLTTYMGDGDPLPPFAGDPLVMPCGGTPEECLDLYWRALNPDNRISLAVKAIDADGRTGRILVQNRFQ